MPQFRFNLVSRADISRSSGGNVMISAIDYDGPNNLFVTGVPGSGKTTVTLMRAERLINQNKTIKVFTYQNLLRTSLRNIASPGLSNFIFGFYEWYYDRFGYFQKTENETELLARMNNEPIVDEILIDEGQDFEERIYRTLLRKCRRMSVGADNAQKVHERGLHANQIRTEIEATRATVPIRLEYNYRNTYEIYNFARHFLPNNERANNPIELNLIPRGNGNLPYLIQVSSDDEMLRRIEILLQDAGDRNVAILLYHQDEVDNYHDRILGLGYSCTKHHHRAQAGLEIENILITTYKSAKGLEFQVVIMPDMQNAMDEQVKTPEHYYIACTRAKENLYLLYKGNPLPDCFSDFDRESYNSVRPELETTQNMRNDNDDLPF